MSQFLESEDDLLDVLKTYLLSEELAEVNDVISFEEAGLLTGNKGLVVSTPITGITEHEFQITIIRRN